MATKIVFSVAVAIVLLLATSSGEPLLSPFLGSRATVKCETPGVSCLDCNTVLICPILGPSITIDCLLPGLKHCNDGVCSHKPSDECAPTTEAPTTTSTAEPTTTSTTTTTQEPTTTTTTTTAPEPTTTTTTEPWSTVQE